MTPALAIVLSVPFDSDALSFFARAGVTDPLAKRRLNNLVKGLKSLGIWNNVVCWPMKSASNAGTGVTLYSLGGYGIYNGTLTNGPTWSASGLVTDGIDDYVQTALTLPVPFSMFARYIQTGATFVSLGMVCDGQNSFTNTGFRFGSSSSGTVYRFQTGNSGTTHLGSPAHSGNPYVLSTWSMSADGNAGGGAMYKDGAVQTTATNAAFSADAAYTNTRFARNVSSYMPAVLESALIANVTLTAAQHRAIHGWLADLV